MLEGRGRVVVIAGPDGTGKSTLAQGLVARISAEGRPVRHFHHRLRALPGSRASTTPTSEPHAHRTYGSGLSAIKVAYLFADELLGWATKVRPFRRAGGWIVVERGWWDLAVDPRRYRLRSTDRLVRLLGRLLPRPDVVLILEVSDAEARRRKAELEIAELGRQREAWRAVARTVGEALIVDAGQSPDVVIADVVRRLGLDRGAHRA
jgi:thymidylate kinase